MNDEHLQQIELSIEQAQSYIDKADALTRLHKNQDFKKVIVDGFFKEEASRAVLLKGDPNIQGAEEQRQINNTIDAIGGLYNYFRNVFYMGDQSSRSLEEDKETRAAILQEQLLEEAVQ